MTYDYEEEAKGMKRELFLLGGIGVGAGLMYWLDPARGRQRRARTRAQLLSTRHLVGDWMSDANRGLHDLRLPQRYRLQLTSPFRRPRRPIVSDAVLLAVGVLSVSALLSWMARSRYTTLRSRGATNGTMLQSIGDWACGVWDGVSTWFQPKIGASKASEQTYEREHELTMMGDEAESTRDVESQ
jgi:hypothetical protein